MNGGNRQLLIWHRRAGKDDINLRMHAVGAFSRVGTYWHMLPEFAQARKAIWNAVNPHSGKRRIDEAFPQEIRENTNDHEMFIRFKSGSTWQCVGSDNFNSLVGTPPIGLTASEWALANPLAWAYLSPILAENGGWASFITTPRGNNHVKSMHDRLKNNPGWFVQTLTVADTGAVSMQAIADQREEYASLFGDDVADMLVEQEFYCSWAGAIVGAFFGSAMMKCEREGRIRPVPINSKYPVHKAWDLGALAVNNPIWCFQVIHGTLYIVDFYRPDSDDIVDWVAWMKAKGYDGTDYVPHDAAHKGEYGKGRTRLEIIQANGGKPKRIPPFPIADGITAGIQSINKAVFHGGEDDRAKRVALGIDGLKGYRREWDDELKTFRQNPVKDWCEHIGSAWRYLSLSWRDIVPPAKLPEKAKEVEFIAQPDGRVIANMDLNDRIMDMIRRRRKDRDE